MRHSFLHTTFDPNNFKTYHASCHCGAIRYEADVSPPLEADHEVVTCNCAMCFRTGAYNVYIPVDKVRYTQGQEKLKVSRPPTPDTPPPGAPTKDTIQPYHYLDLSRNFCPNCSILMTITAVHPDQPSAGIVSVNVRTFVDVEYTKIKVRYVDMKDEEPLWDPDAMSK